MSGFSKRIFRLIGRTINRCIPKKNYSIYAEPHINCKRDKYDIINCNGDNCLKVLNYFLKKYSGPDCVIYLEYYDAERKYIIEQYIQSINNPHVKVNLLLSCWDQKGKKIKFTTYLDFIRNHLTRYSCKVWVSDTGWAHFFDKVKGQVLIDFNYGNNLKRDHLRLKDFTHNHFDYIVDCSMMCAKNYSISYWTDIDKHQPIGMPRNDTIGGSDKVEAVNDWLKKVGVYGKKIIVFVPTFREEKVDFSKTNIFGFEDAGELEKMLVDNNATIIFKAHPLQKDFNGDFSENIIRFSPNYDFTIYDLFSVTDAVVSDYSSISSDFLISHRPVIYLFSDWDKFDSYRGVTFDPIEDACCGQIAYTWNELKNCLLQVLNGCVTDDPNYDIKFRLWHKYDDYKAYERNYQLLRDCLTEG